MRASVDKTQLGRAGELAMALYAMVSSDGELELFTPVADDDHVDATAARRGGVPAIAIQVKTASGLDRNGLVEAKADYPSGHVRSPRHGHCAGRTRSGGGRPVPP